MVAFPTKNALARGTHASHAVRSAELLSDFTWYSRLLIWIGTAIFVVDLFVEGFQNRSLGFPILVAVVFLAAGLVGFLLGLSLDELGRAGNIVGVLPTRAHEAAPAAPETADQEPVIVLDDPKTDVRAVDSPLVSDPISSQPPFEAEASATQATMQSGEDRVAARPAAVAGALSEEVTAETRLAGTVCPLCHEPLRVGQVAGICGTCGGVHHATCWLSNHFHCARDGCSGHGNLVAPSTEDSATR